MCMHTHWLHNILRLSDTRWCICAESFLFVFSV